MGVHLRELVAGRELPLSELSGLAVAIDGNNALYQFISTIRQRDGTPLQDSRGAITSHLSGTFYRTANLVERGLRPVYVFDGAPPAEKRRVLDERRSTREEARERWEEALREGDLDEARKYSQQAVSLTREMVAEAKALLGHMGVPCVDAPSEGEAQAAHLAAQGLVAASASQDYDSLLFGAPTLVRNLTLSGRRKLPGRSAFVPVSPERIELAEALGSLGLSREQLVTLAILVGTDYDPGGVKGVGPKKGLKLVREHGSLSAVMAQVQWGFETPPERIASLFLQPDVRSDVQLSWGRVNVTRLVGFLADQHDFSAERVERTAQALARIQGSGAQGKLTDWF